MATKLREKLSEFSHNRWLVFVAAIWIQSFAGIGYLFGSISPVIKRSLNYNQMEISQLAVAKNLGDSVGFLAGTLCETLPMWGGLLIGALQNIFGYGLVWLIVTGKLPAPPLWAMCAFVFIGTNGETYYNTAALVSCVQNFPKSRGPIVGILKGFAGLSGAIITQIYATFKFPDHASLILIMAVGPFMVVVSLLFIVRPVGGHRQMRPSDDASFTFVYSVCLLLASYLMAVMLVQDVISVSQTVIVLFTCVLFFLLSIPFIIPITLLFSNSPEVSDQPLLRSESRPELILSEVEDEKPTDLDLLPASERHKRIAYLQSKLVQAAAEGAVRIKKRNRPRRGEDFTLTQALVKADFWLIFFSLVLGSGTGVTVIDSLGQISQALGYDNPQILVSIISIWNFLGRFGGGYISEKIVQNYAYPRPFALMCAQLMMSVGHVFTAFGWPGALYVSTFIVGVGYGAHWAVIPATTSELFGLKKFGSLYNFLTLANPLGSFLFCSLLSSSIYDYEAAKQARDRHSPPAVGAARGAGVNQDLACVGSVCYFMTSLIMAGVCVIAALLSFILVRRTRNVYASLYGNTRV